MPAAGGHLHPGAQLAVLHAQAVSTSVSSGYSAIGQFV
jgi:hypothetical protein